MISSSARQLEAEEAKHGTGDADGSVSKVLVLDQVRPYAGGGEPLPPGRVVLFDQLDPLMDLIEIETWFLLGFLPGLAPVSNHTLVCSARSNDTAWAMTSPRNR